MISIPRKMAPGERLTYQLYNELLDYVRRSTPLAGSNVSVDYTMGGARINSQSSGESQIISKNFRLAWFGDTLGVYIPQGSVVLSGTTVQLNAVSENGSDLDGWYEVCDVPVSGESIVTVHVKGRTKATGDNGVHPAVFVSAHLTSSVDSEVHMVGDVHSFEIGRVSSGSGGQSVVQTFTGNVVVNLPSEQPLEMFWKTSSVGVYVPCIKSSTFSIGGSSFNLQQDADVSLSSSGAWLNLDCSGSSPVVSVTGSRVNSNTTLSVQIYSLNASGGMTYDGRQALYSSVWYP